MQGPFAKYRPLGPFAQSDGFRDEFLYGGNEIREGDVYLFITQTRNDKGTYLIRDEIDDTMGSILDFIQFEYMGEITNADVFSEDVEYTITGTIMRADIVKDSNVTQNQVRELFSQNVSAINSINFEDNAVFATDFIEVDI
jgi:hypothetical protein